MSKKIIADLEMFNSSGKEVKEAGKQYPPVMPCKRCGTPPTLYDMGSMAGNAMVQCPHCELEIEVNEWLWHDKFDPMLEAIKLWNYLMNCH